MIRLIIGIAIWIVAVIFICRFLGFTSDIEKNDNNSRRKED
jgi:hypothetical protein